jgi:hypothetical protein
MEESVITRLGLWKLGGGKRVGAAAAKHMDGDQSERGKTVHTDHTLFRQQV